MSRARRLVAATLASIEPPLRATQADATLVAGELLTNALLHGAAPVTLRLRSAGAWLRVEVADASPAGPARLLSGAGSLTGRGLMIVDALATRWGTAATDGGKIVWAEFDAAALGQAASRPVPGPRGDRIDDAAPTDPASAGPASTPAVPRRARPEPAGREPGGPRHGAPPRYQVQLGDVPTDLLLAAKSHVDNLVREFALVSHGAASGATATIPPRLAELIAVVATRFAGPRDAIRRQALTAAAAGRPRTSLELTLPVSAADAAEEYLEALDRADEYARAARLLTVETPPTHRAFRHWYISSLVAQLRAAASGEPPPVPLTFEQYLLDALAAASAAQRTAERSARLQAVTAALASTITPEQVAQVVLTEGVAALGASGGSLLIPHGGDLLAVPGSVGYPQGLVAQLRAERRDAQLPAAQAIRDGEPVWLESAQEAHSRYPQLRQLEPDTVSLCALPMSAGGQVLGALRFSFDYPRLFGPEDRTFAATLAAQCALALERARLIGAERDARARVDFLATAVERLTARLDESEILHQLVTLLVPALGDCAAVYLADHGSPPRLAADSSAHADDPTLLDLEHTPQVRRALQADASASAVSTGSGRHPTAASPADATAVLAVSLRIQSETIGALGLCRPAQAGAFTPDEQSLVSDIADRAAIAMTHARQYQRERQTALTLQRSLLPQRMPRVEGVEFAWRYLPAGAGSLVGGDWYDVLTLDDSTIALLIGDVMGRGIQAAATMGQLRASARANTAAGLAAADVLLNLDAAVSRLEQEQITTVAMAILDPAGHQLRVATAGHLPPLIVPPDGEPRFVDVEPGPPLGAGLPSTSYPQTIIPFEPGSTLLLYTDGLVEDRDRPVEHGMTLLRAAAAHTAGPEDLCERALAALTRDTHDDDTALLAVALTTRRPPVDPAESP